MSQIASLDAQKQKLRETMITSARDESLVEPRHSALIYGPQGAGKSRLARAVAAELCEEGFEYLHIDSLAEREEQEIDALEEVFDSVRPGPAVIVFDCFNRIVPDTDLLQYLESTIEECREADEKIICLGVYDGTQRELEYHSAELGTFPKVRVTVPRPDHDRRERYLRTRLDELVSEDTVTLSEDVETDALADAMDGLTLVDIDQVCTRAVFAADGDTQPVSLSQSKLMDAIEEIADESLLAAEDAGSADVNDDPFVLEEDPDVRYDDIGGQAEAVETVRNAIEMDVRFANLVDQADLGSNSDILLVGPPGTGKTLLAKAVAAETDRTFFAIEGAELNECLFGQSIEIIQQLFERAREEAPSIVFFDEFDALGIERTNVSEGSPDAKADIVNTLLAEINGTANNDDVRVIAASNRPNKIDNALLRPGRLNKIVEMGYPEADGQADIFAIHSEDLPTADAVTAEWFVDNSPEVLSGAEIEAICKESLRAAIQDADESDTEDDIIVTRSHFEAGIEAVNTGEVQEHDGGPTFY